MWTTSGSGSASLLGLSTDVSVCLHSLNTNTQLASTDAERPPVHPPGDGPSFSFRSSPGSSSDHGVGDWAGWESGE